MTEREKELLLAYFVNESIRLDNELREYTNTVRFRCFDVADTLELMIIKQRCEDFDEFCLTVLRLLKMG